MVRTFGDSRRQRSFPSNDALARARGDAWKMCAMAIKRVEYASRGERSRRDATRRDARAKRRLRGATLRDARVTNVCERRVEDHRRIEASKRENERASRANARSAVHARSSAGYARARPQEAN